MANLHGLDTTRGHSLVPTAEELATIPKLYETDGVPFANKTIVLRYFTLTGAEWLVTEVDPDSWLMFGHCDLALGFPEWGYVDLHELATLQAKTRQGYPIYVERDLYFTKCTYAKHLASGTAHGLVGTGGGWFSGRWCG